MRGKPTDWGIELTNKRKKQISNAVKKLSDNDKNSILEFVFKDAFVVALIRMNLDITIHPDVTGYRSSFVKNKYFGK